MGAVSQIGLYLTFIRGAAAESAPYAIIGADNCAPHSFGGTGTAFGSGELKDEREGDNGGGEEFHVDSRSE